MTRLDWNWLLLTTVAVGLPATSAAQAPGDTTLPAIQNIVLRNSFNPSGAGARGQGMGGAFVAVADDGTAASFNPAGLAQLRRTEVAFVGFRDALESTAETAGGVGSTTSSSHIAPEFAGLSVPFKVAGRNMTVELAYQRRIDLFGEGKISLTNRQLLADQTITVTPRQRGAFHTLSLAVGYQATSRLSMGGTVDYWEADWTTSGKLDAVVQGRLANGQPYTARTDIDFDQAQSMHGVSLNTGLLLKYPWFSLGGTVRFGFNGGYNLDESRTQTDTDAAGKTTVQQADYLMSNRLEWPMSIAVGVAIRPFRGMTVAGDYVRAGWSRATLRDVPQGALLTPTSDATAGRTVDQYTDRNFFDLLPASETSTLDASGWRAGAEYLIGLKSLVIPVRGGYFSDRTPIAELGKTSGREIEGWTLGAGLNFSRVVLDIAFERSKSDGIVGARLNRGQVVEAGATTEETITERFVVSLIFRLGAEDPLKRVLGSIFGGSKGGDVQ